ncbi:hypothetical protein EVAR_8097_1 [Eumeta japonica]|uniref:Uncharacterized protein n=1 Tax=Eumeta variegata TaxID=151549 RepID=A0A4C1TT83_EUMVA|nr:hypothetical protein EVAR_8097_1 [Eumeta japonica]
MSATYSPDRVTCGAATALEQILRRILQLSVGAQDSIAGICDSSQNKYLVVQGEEADLVPVGTDEIVNTASRNWLSKTKKIKPDSDVAHLGITRGGSEKSKLLSLRKIL